MSRVLNEGDPSQGGSNGNGPSERVILNHYRTMKDLESQKNSISAKISKHKAQCKEDGVDYADLKFADGLRALAIEELAAREARRHFFVKCIVPSAVALFPPIDAAQFSEVNQTEEQRQEKWITHGYVAGGVDGKSLDVAMEGHDPNGETGRWILEGWQKGQAENAAGIKQKPAENSSDAETGTLTGGKITPKDEPEVAEAKAKRGRPKKSGILYWHNAETKKVYRTTSADAEPEGAVQITEEEADRLQKQYDDDWDNSAPPTTAGASEDEAPPEL